MRAHEVPVTGLLRIQSFLTAAAINLKRLAVTLFALMHAFWWL